MVCRNDRDICTGAIIVQQLTGELTHVGVAMTFGLIVTTMIITLGDISGAHLNPAVTIAFWLSKRFPGKSIFPYIAAQLLGAFIASACLGLLFPESGRLGSTEPLGDPYRSLWLEMLLTFLLMFVIIHVATGSKEKGLLAGLAIGSLIMLEAMFAGPITGASMNPARSIAPAVLSGRLTHLWIYVVGPIVGAAIAIGVWRIMTEDNQDKLPII